MKNCKLWYKGNKTLGDILLKNNGLLCVLTVTPLYPITIALII